MKIVTAALIVWLALASVVGVAFTGLYNHEIAEREGKARVDCISYAPWRKHGESPFDHRAVSRQRISTDLRTLKTLSSCVRTYSSRFGMDQVASVAASLEMRVLQGIWISRDEAANQAEIDVALQIAADHPHTVKALVVGNEVLLRREQTEAGLQAIIKEVRRRSPVAVTYADVWEFWAQHPGLADSVDFVSIHILPYWEDHPVAVGQAIDHVLGIHRQMQDRFPAHDLFIGETGWPSAGKQRGPAVPGQVAQAHFIRAWITNAARHGIDYNLIEAFDQPWKRRLEGAMGGAWGLFDSEGLPKFSMTGPVANHPVMSRWMLSGLFLALVAGLIVQTRNDKFGPRRKILSRLSSPWPAAAGLAGALLVWQWHDSLIWNRSWLEWALGGGFAMLGTALFLSASWLIDHDRNSFDVSTHSALSADQSGLAQDLTDQQWPVYLRLMACLVLFGSAYFVLLHAFDSRYRGFPVAHYMAPALGLILMRVTRPRTACLIPGLGWLAPITIAGSLVMMWQGWPDNDQALRFAVLPLLIGIAGLAWPNPGRPGIDPKFKEKA